METFLPYLPGFLAAFSILLIAASSPGPAVAMLLGIATTQGRTPALIAATGIASGSVVINVATLIGVGLLLSKVAWAMTALRFVGAAYLAYLAYGAFKKVASAPVIKAAQVDTVANWKHFTAGFLLQVTNPKAIVFWLAIASVGATQGGDLTIIAAFVAGSFLISFGCHGAWALLLSARPFRTAYQSARRWIEGALGVFFAFAAFKLATTRI